MNKKLFVVVLTGTLAMSASAKSLISTSIEPIVGYERVQKFIPTVHTKDRLIYGARLIVGVPLVSGEAEYTRGEDTEAFPSQSLTVKESSQRAKLGLRSSLKLISVVSLIVRAGGQATSSRTETTSAGVTSVTTAPLRYNPYAGAGLRVRLGAKVHLDGDVVTVFKDFPNMNNNEYQTTLGMSISFP